MVDESIINSSALDNDKARNNVSRKKNSKKAKKEPKERKPREISVQKDINLFDNVKNDRKRNVKKNASKLNLICICGLVLIVGVSYIAALKLNSDTKYSIKAAERYINDPMLKIQMDNIDRNKSDVEQIGRLASSARTTHEAMQIRPLIDSKILSSIIKCMPKTVTFTGIEYNRGVIILSCKSKTDIVAADFANSLKGVDRFKSVTYETVSRSIDTVSAAKGIADTVVNGLSGQSNVALPSNVTGVSGSAGNSGSGSGTGNSAAISANEVNGTTSILKKNETGGISSSTTQYKYDYKIIVTLDDAEVDPSEVK